MTVLSNLISIFSSWNYAAIFVSSGLLGYLTFAAAHYLCSIRSFVSLICRYTFAILSVMCFSNFFVMIAECPNVTNSMSMMEFVFPSSIVLLAGTFLYKVFHQTTDELNNILNSLS